MPRHKKKRRVLQAPPYKQPLSNETSTAVFFMSVKVYLQNRIYYLILL